jgi:tRNA-specific 2-thiouridylase
METAKRAIIAMSGGVDSSVAAMLAREQGLDCVGITMKLLADEGAKAEGERVCCSFSDAEDARRVADLLDFPFFVFNLADNFRCQVIEPFIRAYCQAATPNPCIDCNRFIKFGLLLQRALAMGRDYLVTGHYARIEADRASGRYLLKKGLDTAKDQSYVLYALNQRQLAHSLFPLGELSKQKVRALAAGRGLVTARKAESQDICFTGGRDYAKFIINYSGYEPKPGAFVDAWGKVLGQHRGLIHYTVGQRRGLRLCGPEPLYVRALDLKRNQVVVGEARELYSKRVQAVDLNLIALERISGSLKVKAKLRYQQTEQEAIAWQPAADSLLLEFAQPQRAACPGQAVVLYDHDLVIGGGVIA